MNTEYKTFPSKVGVNKETPEHLSLTDSVYQQFERFTFGEQIEITQTLMGKLRESIQFAIDSHEQKIDYFNNEIKNFSALLKQISPEQ